MFPFGHSIGQDQVDNGETLSLDEVLEMAMDKSISSLKASTIRKNSYWQWRTFKSNYLPQLSLDGVLPEFNRIISPVTQPDGNIKFQPISNSSSFLNLSLIQGISATGGEVFVNSQMQRFDDFQNHATSYNSNPAIIGFRQPLFAFNNLNWDRKIEPLRYEESEKLFNEEMEVIRYVTTQYYFQLLQEQIALSIAKKNLANNDTILKIAQVKYELGKINRGEILQLQLALKNDQKSLAQAKLAFETAILNLSTYIGLTLNEGTTFIIPEILPQFQVDEQIALNEAKKNRQKAVAFRRAIVEADRAVAKAKGDNGLNAQLFASFGLTNRADNIPDIYQNLDNQQSIRLGFTIPIMDWGRSASRIKTAQANQELIRYSVAQDEINFNQEIYTQIRQFEMLREQVNITNEANQIAGERYNIFKERYLIGELSLTDLNIAQQEKDQATRDFIKTVKDFWEANANLRLLTLYDFEQQKTIIYKSNI
ncbi:MAG: TolC family protein [Bacteroidota bacterium]|nr:TolC family protein [Bacteroidota bacterium]